MSSTVLAYSKLISALGSGDGDIVLSSPLQFRERQHLEIQLLKTSFSTYMPNVYNDVSSGINNGLIRVSRDGGATWTSVQLPDGTYTMSYIQSAINTAVSTWWTLLSDPGFIIQYNYATKLTYIQLDTTKLAAGTQLGIDLSQSLAYELLGYDLATCMFITDGLHGGARVPSLDWFGNNVSLQLTNLGPLSVKNGTQSNELTLVPLVNSSTSANIYVYPINGIEQPRIPLQSSRNTLDRIGIRFVGSRTNADGSPRGILWLEGEINVELLLRWSI